MPVPASFNDITQEKKIRDFVGVVWYQREILIPKDWNRDRVFIRFESVHYTAKVFLGDQMIARHEGGHLPFEAEITAFVSQKKRFLLSVSVNNTLTKHTLPCGHVKHMHNSYTQQFLQFDFFNYAGIHRDVVLYSVPRAFISDVELGSLLLSNNSAQLSCKVNVSSPNQELSLVVDLIDKAGNLLFQSPLVKPGTNKWAISNVIPWWPIGMSRDVAYLYTVRIKLLTPECPCFQSESCSCVLDEYSLKHGFRDIKVTESQFLINSKPFYFRGTGRHEDYHVRGRSMDLVGLIKDFNLMNWLGMNSFRTSHYPYSSETLDLCDEYGIVVIAESTAVGLGHLNFLPQTQQHHLQVLREMYARDKNHASIVMWSLANEPTSDIPEALEYFKPIFQEMRLLDGSRPVTCKSILWFCSELEVATNKGPSHDKVARLADVICINRYMSWYTDSGHLEIIEPEVSKERMHF
jgi:beta-glucuronidase